MSGRCDRRNGLLGSKCGSRGRTDIARAARSFWLDPEFRQVGVQEHAKIACRFPY